MGAEKFIKNEAKGTLQGNWPISILAVMVLCFIPIIVVLVVGIAYALVSNQSDSVLQAIEASPLLAVFFVLFHILAVLTLLLLSPLMNGFAKIFCSLADKKTADFSDMFYFFDTKERYFSSVKFMTFIIVRAVMILIVSEIPAVALYAFSNKDEIMIGFAIAFAILGLIVTFGILHRYVFANMLYSYYEFGITESFSTGASIAKGNYKSLFKLSFTFIPWLLLTFFVVPFLYVYPYMTCSYFISAKYLYQKYQSEVSPIGVSEQSNLTTEAFNFMSNNSLEQSDTQDYKKQADVLENTNTFSKEATLSQSTGVNYKHSNNDSLEPITNVAVSQYEGGKVAEDL